MAWTRMSNDWFGLVANRCTGFRKAEGRNSRKRTCLEGTSSNSLKLARYYRLKVQEITKIAHAELRR